MGADGLGSQSEAGRQDPRLWRQDDYVNADTSLDLLMKVMMDEMYTTYPTYIMCYDALRLIDFCCGFLAVLELCPGTCILLSWCMGRLPSFLCAAFRRVSRRHFTRGGLWRVCI